MVEDGLVYKAEPQTVLETLVNVITSGNTLKKYPPKTQGLLIEMIDEMLL